MQIALGFGQMALLLQFESKLEIQINFLNKHEYKYTLQWDLDSRREGSDHTFRSATTAICILESNRNTKKKW